MRYHIAPSIYLLEMSGLCGRRTTTGRNVLDFKSICAGGFDSREICAISLRIMQHEAGN